MAERKTKETNGVFAKIRLYKLTCLPPNKVSCLPTKLLVCTLSKEVNKILQAPPSKLRPEMGMCVTTIYVQQQQYYYTIRVLIVRTPLSNLSFQAQHIPGNWYLVRYMQAPNRLYNQIGGSVSRVKSPCEQGLPHYPYVLQEEQRLHHATEKARRSLPMERGPNARHHPAWNPLCTQWFRAEEFPLLCPKPHVMPRLLQSR